MAKGYWIVRVDIADPERYKAYTTANAKPLAKYGGVSWFALASSKTLRERAELATQ